LKSEHSLVITKLKNLRLTQDSETNFKNAQDTMSFGGGLKNQEEVQYRE